MRDAWKSSLRRIQRVKTIRGAMASSVRAIKQFLACDGSTLPCHTIVDNSVSSVPSRITGVSLIQRIGRI